jgi:hypothetical protein
VAAGDTRRAESLGRRAARLQAELDDDRDQLIAAARTVDAAASAAPQGSDGSPAEGARTRFLDAQAALPGLVEAYWSGSPERRDYAALAGLAGYGPREYRQLSARERRIARVAIDRELALRRSARRDAGANSGEGARPSNEHSSQGQTSQRSTPSDHGVPAAARRTPPRRSSSTRPARGGFSESRVMRDVREVEAGRKRQLGYDQP